MRDEWSGLADLLAGLIEKYIDQLELDALPDPAPNPCNPEKDVEIPQTPCCKGSGAMV